MGITVKLTDLILNLPLKSEGYSIIKDIAIIMLARSMILKLKLFSKILVKTIYNLV